jgi:shikimate dehydrogenase
MRCGLIGEKLTHSYSAQIHNLLGNYSYELFSLPPRELEPFIARKDFDGLNVTIPYKKSVMPLCDILDDSVTKIGSVNTIVRDKDGLLHGYNTDYAGFRFMSRRAGINFGGKKVLVLGSGGTSLTASAAAADEGAREVITVSRTGNVNYSNLASHRDCEIIINTTPVGMYPDNGKSLIDLKDFHGCIGVLDAIYNPLSTRLILQAKELGIPHSNGLPMLVAQAKYASELFTGDDISDGRIEDILDGLIHSICNIVLVGMPGSGKTEIGRLAASALGREFIDTDRLIIDKAGMDIPDIFSHYGEPHFRKLESEVIAESCKLSGKVIATGGGSIMSKENRLNMKQNGFVCFLQCDLNKLQTAGRPLSKSTDALIRMYRERLPLYKECSDAVVYNNGSDSNTVNAILEVFNAYSCNQRT